MRLLTLTLTNFKGIRDLTIDAGGANVSIYSENGVGKTTVADAALWLLFGKDTLGRKDFEIKTTVRGEVQHFLDHSVESMYQMDDGEKLTLSRTYKEDWSTQRGSSSKTFVGHTTTYAVNGVPQTATEYVKVINSICDEGRFRLLTDPSHFLSLPWADRRKMLFEVCGDMTDAEVIAASPEIEELGRLIGKYSIVDFQKINEAAKKATTKERTELPARIDEALRAIPAEDKTDWESLYAERQAKVAPLYEERATLLAGGAAAGIRSQIVDAESKQRAIVSELRNAPDVARETAVKMARDYDGRLSAAKRSVADLADTVSSMSRRLDVKNQELTEKRERALSIKNSTFSGASECPTCKRELPEDQVQAAIEEFNSAKANRLEKIVADGKALVAERDKWLSDLDTVKSELDEANTLVESIQSEGQIVVPEIAIADPFKNPQYVRLDAEISRLSKELNVLALDNADAVVKIDERIKAAQEAVTEAHVGINRAKARKDGLVRVEALKTREKELSAQYELLERGIYLCEQFVRAKVRLLTDRINGRFNLTTFRLFKEQINGGLTECCDVLWRENGAIPSHGQSIQIGLDIIHTLSDHIQFYPPIFIDNAESLTSFPETKGQQIRLIVSPGDTTLRIETDPIMTDALATKTTPTAIDVPEQDLEPALF